MSQNYLNKVFVYTESKQMFITKHVSVFVDDSYICDILDKKPGDAYFKVDKKTIENKCTLVTGIVELLYV